MSLKNIISQQLGIKDNQILSTLNLLSDGATIPFISRYRKEATGGLDEVQIANIDDLYKKLLTVEKRKEAILKSIAEQGVLSDEIKNKISLTWELNELEDIYLPFKPKRKTRASVAKENGLEPLASIILKQTNIKLENEIIKFLNDKIENESNAIQGAIDIIAENISENALVRDKLRKLFLHDAYIYSKIIKGKEEDGEKFKDYFDYNEKIAKCPSHRFLAIQRGESEGYLRVKVFPNEDLAIEMLEKIFIKAQNESSEIVKKAIKDSYKRLLMSSIENEVLALVKEKADDEAIRVFSSNLRQLLLASPLGQKRILAIDPGYRTGCKIVCLDDKGDILYNETIYPHKPQEEKVQAIKKISSMVDAYKIDPIAIGNGTAGRETENFIQQIKFSKKIQVFVVSENGASIYSASSVAREEFPQYDVTVRGAISIGRRLMDPLSELVKIEPKSIGVGQYQYDVDQKKLKEKLDFVVESCVNAVGVNLNTASKHLLTYVSGLGPQIAQNIVDFRKENGIFTSREELKKVARLGDKAFEQCAGFLRINNAKNPLDNSSVHPESYSVVNKIAKDLNCDLSELIANEEIIAKINLEKYVTEKVGLPTLEDIKEELLKPGRDIRKIIKVFEFSKDVQKIEDLKIGMELPGIVTNITNFGAFVDVGVKQDGLVHISNLANRYISNPNDVVCLHQHVKVKVIDVDALRKRIQLSMKEFDNESNNAN